jgi:hypothetical protein
VIIVTLETPTTAEEFPGPILEEIGVLLALSQAARSKVPQKPPSFPRPIYLLEWKMLILDQCWSQMFPRIPLEDGYLGIASRREGEERGRRRSVWKEMGYKGTIQRVDLGDIQ